MRKYLYIVLKSFVVNFLYYEVIAHKFEQSIIICYQQQPNANDVLVFMTIKDEEKLNGDSTKLY